MSDGEVARAISLALGWTYFICWSVSFYPQPIRNIMRRSTTGLSVDFPLANLIGLSSYTIYTSAFLFSPVVRAEYAKRQAGSTPSVRMNDLWYGIHGTLLIVLVYSQFSRRLWGFHVESSQRPSLLMLVICTSSIIAVLIVMVLATINERRIDKDAWGWAWIDVIYALGDIKLFLTIVKYVPQVWINYKRKSTLGLAVDAILLDFIGGLLSIFQLLLDASTAQDWSAVIGNPAKVMLGNITIFFDIIMLTQNYVVYPRGSRKQILASEQRGSAGSEGSPLLRANGEV